MAKFGIKKVSSKDKTYDVYLLQPLESDEPAFRAMVPKGTPEALFLENARQLSRKGDDGSIQKEDRAFATADLNLEDKGIETGSEQEVALALERNGKVTYIREATPAVVYNRGIRQKVDGEVVTTPFNRELDELTRKKMRFDIYGAMMHNVVDYDKSPEAYEMLRGFQQDNARTRIKEDIAKLRESRRGLNLALSTAFVGATLKRGFPAKMLGLAYEDITRAGPQYAHSRLALLNEQMNNGVDKDVLKQTLKGFNMSAKDADSFLRSFAEATPEERTWFTNYFRPSGKEAQEQKLAAFMEAAQVNQSTKPFQETLESRDGGDRLLSTLQFRGMNSERLQALQQSIKAEQLDLSQGLENWPSDTPFLGPDKVAYQVQDGQLMRMDGPEPQAVQSVEGFGTFIGPDGDRYLMAEGGALRMEADGSLVGRNGPISERTNERLQKLMEEVAPPPKEATPAEKEQHFLDLKLSLMRADPTMLESVNRIQDGQQLEKLTRLATEYQAQEQDLRLLDSAHNAIDSNQALPPNSLQDLFQEGDTLALEHDSVLHTDTLMDSIRKDTNEVASQRVADFYYKQALVEDLASRNMMAAHQGHMTDCQGHKFWEGNGGERILQMANPYLYEDADSKHPRPTEQAQRMFKGMSRTCAVQMISQLAVAKTEGKVKFDGAQPNQTFRRAIDGYLDGRERTFDNILMATGLTVEQAREGTQARIKETNKRTLGRIEDMKMQQMQEMGNRGLMYSVLLMGTVAQAIKRLDPEMV